MTRSYQLVITLLTIPLVTPSLYGPKDQVLQLFMAQINKVQRQGAPLLVGMVFDLIPSTFQVVILDADNFHSTLEGRPHAWMVEFYASW